MLGISEEQHGDRTQLFMQWQQMDWPVLIDSLNLIQVSAVPITLLIDQSGVIRFKNPRDKDLEAFLATDYPATPSPEPVTWSPALTKAVAAVNTGNTDQVTDALKTFQKITEKSPRQWFHLGVLHRKRFDSTAGDIKDFSNAVTAWGEALSGNPGQYIWRRRIQQYGPRLDKPYPFYDWVPEARTAIISRGHLPTPLVAEPTGAEFAAPATKTGAASAQDAETHPDPHGRVPADDKNLITVTSVPVPSTDTKKPGWRVHLTFTPNENLDAHWNNESGDTVIWWETTDGWSPPISVQGKTVPMSADAAGTATSNEPRRIEFEFHPTADAPIPSELRGDAFVYACESSTGTCIFMRKSFTVNIK